MAEVSHVGLVTSAETACAGAAARERASAGSHPGKLLAAARRMREAQAALAAGASHADEGYQRARGLLQEALDKEARSRAEAEAARLRGERLVAKSLRRTERRAGRTLERARELMDGAARRRAGCGALAESLGMRAEALEKEGHDVLAMRCSTMAGMTVRVDIMSIREAGGAAWGPPSMKRAGKVIDRKARIETVQRVEAISTPARDLALGLLRSLLGEHETLPNTGLPEQVAENDSFEAEQEAA